MITQLQGMSRSCAGSTRCSKIKTQIIGPEGDKIGKVLNRVITYTGSRFELEADQRHSEMIIVEQLGVLSS